MDIECSGWVSLDELQLALYHVGIQLTEQDFQRLCHSLESSDIIASEDQRIKYMKLIAFIEDPANSHQEASSSMSLQRVSDPYLFLQTHNDFTDPEINLYSSYGISWRKTSTPLHIYFVPI